MTQIQKNCQDGILKVIKAMEAALEEASGEHAPPLPSAGKRSLVVPIVGNNNNNLNNNSEIPHGNQHTSNNNANQTSSNIIDMSGSGGGGVVVDTAIQKREKWENHMRSRLAPLAADVKDACADLHENLEQLSEFALDEERCEHAKNDMQVRTAQMEVRIVELYSNAARKEEELVKELEKMAAAGKGKE